jgi:hypothetical protein
MSSPTELTAVEIAAGIKAKDFSAVAVAQAHLDRIANVNDKLNAFFLPFLRLSFITFQFLANLLILFFELLDLCRK